MKKKVIFNIAILILSSGITLITAEGAFRIWASKSGWSRAYTLPLVMQDPVLGWRTSANHKFESVETDLSGARYHVKYSTDQYGFRLAGALDSRKPKILILGDSFTSDYTVSDDRTYFHLLAQRMPEYEFFAYGAPGYGTLQELLILDELLDLVKPDLFILQFCSNDIINNHYQMEIRSYLNNNHHRRPYVGLDGRMFYATPHTSWLTHVFGELASWLGGDIKILHFLHERITRKEAELYQAGSIDVNGLWDEKNPLVLEGIQITSDLVGRIKKKLGNTPFYAFSADEEGHTMGISHYHHVRWIKGVNHAIAQAEKQGAVARHSDGGHWNNRGNEIAADVSYQGLEEYGATKTGGVISENNLASKPHKTGDF